MGYADAARAALTELDTLSAVRKSTVDERHRSATAAWLLDYTRFDWEAINSTLFPNGNPLDVDLTNPDVLQEWITVRSHQLDIAYGWLDSWVEDPDAPPETVFVAPGLECRVPTRDLVARDGNVVPASELWRLLQRHFPRLIIGDPDRLELGITPPAVSQTSSEPLRGESRFMYLNRSLMREAVSRLFRGRVALSPQALDRSRVRSALEALAYNVDWRDLVRMYDRTYAAYAAEWAEADQLNASMSRSAFDVSKTKLVEHVEARLALVRNGLTPDTALDQFSAWNFLGARAANANAGRTWGIELEIIDAGAIAFDAAGGWQRVRDGSLRQQIGDGKTYDPWEFVSPVLSTTFSEGLWMICDQAGHTVKYHKAGVHVHVAATTRTRRVYDRNKRKQVTVPGRRMTRQEVSRLLELYASVTPLIDQIIRRTRTREFCVPTRVDQWVKGWHELPTSKNPRKAMRRANSMTSRDPDAIKNARMWAQITKGPNHDAEHTEWKRHQEINLQALNKYGTIEFRSMGPVYDYEHLLKWAWMCRSMVDFAMSDAPMSELRGLTDMASLIALLNKYSQEPLSKLSLAAA